MAAQALDTCSDLMHRGTIAASVGSSGAERWDRFVEAAPGGDVVQTTVWAEAKRARGFEVCQAVAQCGDEIAGGGQIMIKRFGRLGALGYVARGPLVRRACPEQAALVLAEIERAARARRVRHLIVQPPEGGDHVIAALAARGYAPDAPEVSPSATLRIDLSQSLEQILARICLPQALATPRRSSAQPGIDRIMSLSPPASREPIHHRRIDCRGYRRADGLWDIEGHLSDTKSYPFANSFRGEIAPGEPIHDMWLRLTLDDEFTVIRAEAATEAGPFAVCPAITPAFAKLEGLTIGPGWRRAVQARLGGVQGCTHLVELLGPLATTAYQTVHAWRARHEPRVETDRPPSHLDSCHALARDGAVVRQHYPRWYTGPGPEPGA